MFFSPHFRPLYNKLFDFKIVFEIQIKRGLLAMSMATDSTHPPKNHIVQAFCLVFLLTHSSRKLMPMEKKLLRYYLLMEDSLFPSQKSPNDLGSKVPLDLI